MVKRYLAVLAALAALSAPASVFAGSFQSYFGGYCVTRTSNSSGTAVVAWDCSHPSAKVSFSSGIIKFNGTNLCLRASGGTTLASTCGTSSVFKWTFQTSCVPSQGCLIKNSATNTYLYVASNARGARVNLTGANLSHASRRWRAIGF